MITNSAYDSHEFEEESNIPAFIRLKEAGQRTDLTKSSSTLVIGVAGAGMSYVEHLMHRPVNSVDCILVDSEQPHSTAIERANRNARQFQSGAIVSRLTLSDNSSSTAWSELVDEIKRHHIAVINVGLGGYSGSTLTPMIAQTVKHEGLQPIIHCSIPSQVEGSERRRRAQSVISELSQMGCYTLQHDNEMLSGYAEFTPENGNSFEVVHQLFDEELQLLAPLAAAATSPINYRQVKAARDKSMHH
jgi:cell division GTPase FtsZ